MNFVGTRCLSPSHRMGRCWYVILWLSFDPTQRGWMAWHLICAKVPLGEVMRASSVGQVIGYDIIPNLSLGHLVQGLLGWQDYIATDGRGPGGLRKLPPGVPPNTALSIFGITGTTAFFGITDIGQVKDGETVVISGAAGSTGSVAGQIAKIKGCRVVGTAGGKEKCDWLMQVAGFDGAIDYKSEDIGSRLSALCPNGSMSSSIMLAVWSSMRFLHE